MNDTSYAIDYSTALDLIEQGKYEEAYYAFRSLAKKGNKEARKKLADFKVEYDRIAIENKDGNKEYYDSAYDENGNKIKEVCTYPDGDKEITDYTYDTNGNLIKEVDTNSDGDKWIRDYTYDTNGNLIKEAYTFPNGDKDITDYTYDKNGNMIKEVNTNSDGTIGSSEQRKYDKKGRLTKQCSTIQGLGKTITKYKYNNDLLISSTESAHYGDKYITTYTYDDLGLLILETNRNVKYGGKTVTTYDITGKKMKTEYTNREETIIEYECICDESGIFMIKENHIDPLHKTTSTTEYSGYHVFYRPKKK